MPTDRTINELWEVAAQLETTYSDRELALVAILRELKAAEGFREKAEAIFTAEGFDSVLDDIIDTYYDLSRVSAQSLAWALMELLEDDNGYTFKLDENGYWRVHPDYEPDDSIFVYQAVIDLL
jgi:hypothetical protein